MRALEDYLDTFESLAPIPGQPGLFRSAGDRAPVNARDESGFEIAESRGARRTAMSQWVTTKTTLAGCGCGGNARPGLQGLRSVATAQQRARAAWDRYTALKSDVQQLLSRFPTLDGATFRQIAQHISTMPQDAVVRLTSDELALLLRAGISVTAQNLGLANAILAGPFAAQNESKALKLVSTAESVLSSLEMILSAINTGEGYADRAARAVGLREPLTISTGALIAAIVAGSVVALVGGVLLYTLMTSIYQAAESYAAAYQACERAAAAGQPCTGEDWMRFRARAQEQQRENGIVPNIGDLFSRGMNALIVGGFVVGAAMLAYGFWVTAPAARETRSALQRRAASY
jgi:hypothetical protein